MVYHCSILFIIPASPPPLPLLFIRWRDGNWFYLSRRPKQRWHVGRVWNSNSRGIDQQSRVSICWWDWGQKRELEEKKGSRDSQFPHELLQRGWRGSCSPPIFPPSATTELEVDQHPQYKILLRDGQKMKFLRKFALDDLSNAYLWIMFLLAPDVIHVSYRSQCVSFGSAVIQALIPLKSPRQARLWMAAGAFDRFPLCRRPPLYPLAGNPAPRPHASPGWNPTLRSKGGGVWDSIFKIHLKVSILQVM